MGKKTFPFRFKLIKANDHYYDIIFDLLSNRDLINTNKVKVLISVHIMQSLFLRVH